MAERGVSESELGKTGAAANWHGNGKGRGSWNMNNERLAPQSKNISKYIYRELLADRYANPYERNIPTRRRRDSGHKQNE